MNKKELITKIAEHNNLNKNQVEGVLKSQASAI